MSDPKHLLDDPEAIELIASRAPLSDGARSLPVEGRTPRRWVEDLASAELFPDVAWVLAHALPKREAVWWACLCARRAHAGELPRPDADALASAERWVVDPTESNRRDAQTASEAAGLGTPAGCAAMAAFFSGGSLAPPNVPAVPPSEHLTAHAVAGSVMLAAVASEPEKAPEKYRAFLDLGLALADGAERWPAAPAPAPPAAAPPSSASPAPKPRTPPPASPGTWDDAPVKPPVLQPDPQTQPPPARKRWDQWE